MAAAKLRLSLLLLPLFFLLGSSANNLRTDYYKKSCPNVLDVVKPVVKSAIDKEKRMGASLLRLHFHDCFVNGCDGSLLLDDTSSFTGEKGANANKNSARGFEVIDAIKATVEDNCKQTVSCADIVAIAARDSVNLLGGPYWEVKLGRRDSTTASLTQANNNIPPPTSSITNLIKSFQKQGLSIQEMVTLAGAHTIGQARCTSFRSRIYSDSDIDNSFSAGLKKNCPPNTGNNDSLAALDFQTPTVFDNLYYQNLVKQKGLLHSDQQLFSGGNSVANSSVQQYAADARAFGNDFVNAMIKMGDISPLTGSKGEIRKNCRKVNG